MKNKTLPAIIFALVFSLPVPAFCQNYVGFSKGYIIDAIEAQRPDLEGPVVMNNEEGNYMLYSTKDERRAIVYYFEPMPVALENGGHTEADICVKYFSMNKCQGYARCPEMDVVVNTLNSHFTPGSHHQWIDYSRKNPQEWVIVRDEDYFEIHVMEVTDKRLLK